ncbi:unnamed protein product [Linum trigynum]|uniref:Uncharacterized protein n=1 Tax=Linum trigynum TaxID=586398 RepID=A0AAV2ETZ5_9ROSI
MEEQDALRKEVDALNSEKASLLVNHEAEVDVVRAEASPAYLKSAEFLAYDKVKYNEVVGNVVGAISHMFRREQPDVAWDTNRVWDAIYHWSSFDVTSEADGSEEDEVGDEEESVEEGDAGSRGSQSVGDQIDYSFQVFLSFGGF